MSAPLVDEPLAESAPLALRLAATRCRADPATGESCAWNHGPWQFLRLMGLALAPANNAGFYLGAIRSVTPRGSSPRVLVSAAADYSMLAHVLAAMRSLDCSPDVTVVDVCETPLELSRWYAERVGVAIHTRASDILDLRDPDPFDLICTDNFLGRFEGARRSALVEKWRDLLRPGGAAITLNRISEARAPPMNFTPEQAAVFRALARKGAQSLREKMTFEAAELERLVDAYVTHPGPQALVTRDGFLDAFLGAGFSVKDVSWGGIESGIRGDVAGPRVPRAGEYGRIIALRR